MKKVFGFAVLGLVIYGMYVLAMAGHSYITVSNILDEVVPRQIGTQGVADQQGANERNERVRGAVAQAVTAANIPIDKSAVTFTEEKGKLAVRVECPYPVVSWQGETKVAVPVAVTTNFLLPPPRN
jgi:hypothetical protein